MKRYFASFKHIPGVLGVLFLALLIGGSVLFSGTANALNTMTSEIQFTTGQADLSTTRIWDAIKNSLAEDVTTGEYDQDGNKLVSTEEATNVVNQSIEDALSETVDNYADYVTKVSESVGNAVGTILLMILAFVAIQIISWIVGKWYVLANEKADFARQGEHTFKGWLLHNGLIVVVFIIVIAGFCINETVGVIILCLYPLLYCIASLMSSNLAFDKKDRLSMKEALRVKNVLCLLGTNILQIILTVILAVIAVSVANLVIGIYLVITLFIIALATTTINSDAIISSLIDKD